MRLPELPTASGAPAPAAPFRLRGTAIALSDFSRDLWSGTDEGAHAVCTAGRWSHLAQPGRGQDAAEFFRAYAGLKNAFITIAALRRAARPARDPAQVVAVPTLHFEIDDPDIDAARRAVERFSATTGVGFTHYTESGHGLHVYLRLSRPLPLHEWQPLADQLKHACIALGVPADHQCTADPVRLLRLPQTINSKPEKGLPDVESIGYRVDAQGQPHEPEVIARLLAPHVPREASSAATSRVRLDVNAALGVDLDAHFPFNAANEAQVRSAVEALVASLRGKPFPYELWRDLVFALASLDAVFGWAGRGLAFACELSRRTPGYTDDESVERLAASYEPQRQSRISIGTLFHVARERGWSSPAVPGAAAAAASLLPEWLAEMNTRYAVARIGSGVEILDCQSPSQHVDGMRCGPGFLDMAAFRQLLRGRTVLVGGKHESLTDAWLRHPQRRQYEGVAFAPGDTLPDNILNLWQGFALQPQEGDVSPWLELLENLVAEASVRAYVLRWLAWKVQHPGAVPGTILVVTGGKGSGKNSLFDPVLRMFGAHGRLFDDSEQIAGRFTGHLMTVAFAVLDEALFTGDPRQADRVKSRVTATHATYEFKGRDPIPGRNRCAFVSLSNHLRVWQATIDERRAAVVEASSTLTARRDFWSRYYAWLDSGGAAALLHHLQSVDLSGFDVRVIPRSEALRRQIELTALSDGAAAWWHAVLTEGTVTWRENGFNRTFDLLDDREASIPQSALRASFEAGGRRRDGDFPAAMKKLRQWHTIRTTRPAAASGSRQVAAIFAPLPRLREQFSAATGIHIDTPSDES